MAYFYESTIKQRLVSTISKLAQKLGIQVVFEDLDVMNYTDLILLRNDLVAQYNEQTFTNDKTEPASV